MRKVLLGLAFLASACAIWPLTATAGEKKDFAGNVSEWSSTTVPAPGILPIGGSGQVNGNFVVSERNGIQIGLRAQRRFFQNIAPLPSVRETNVGVYSADAGASSPNRATWNYDIHVDLRGGFGVAKGKTLDDYTLTLDTNIGDTLFNVPVPVNIGEEWPFPLGPAGVPNVVLYQQSENPVFGNPAFDINADGLYTFTLTLTPKTFNGAPIVARMSVIVD